MFIIPNDKTERPDDIFNLYTTNSVITNYKENIDGI